MLRCSMPVLLLPLLSFPLAARGQSVTEAPINPATAVIASPWSGSSGEFGYAAAHGNSATDSLNGRIKLRYTDDDWIHSLDATALRSSSEYNNINGDGTFTRKRQVTAERYTGSVGSALQLGEHRQLTATGRYEYDNFAAYDRLATFGIGYGTRLIDRQRFYLDTQVGPGMRRAHNRQDDQNETGPIVRGLFEMKYALTKNSDLINNLLIESGKYNTYAQNDFGVQVSMNTHFALKAAWQMRHNSKVNEGNEKTDTLTTVNLVYTFK